MVLRLGTGFFRIDALVAPLDLIFLHNKLALDLLQLQRHIFQTALLLDYLRLQAFVLLLLRVSLLVQRAEVPLQLAQRRAQLNVLCLAVFQPFL